ncbi:MAG: DUF3842 family protein [Lachnospiraceae bacterium]|jgi:hypothetical protein|nr:DUF3842 family protein [Lachnospiraceae bacterium]
MDILVMDAQGGGLGKQLITKIKNEYPDVHILAVGTNTIATSAMIKAGADEAATGENSVVVASKQADIIIGPIGIVVADSMLGEITPTMARAVAQSGAKRILIPFNSCQNYIAGVGDLNTGRLVEDAVAYLKKLLDN